MGSQAAAGQIPAPRMVAAQKTVAPAITVFRAESTPLLAPSFLLSQDRENALAYSSLRFPGPVEGDLGLELLSPVIKIKTLILTQVSLPLVQLWDGKLEAGRLSEYTAHSERAVWRSTKFSGRVAFGPFLRPQSELSFWPGRTDATPEAGMAVCAANCGRPSKLNYIAVVWKSRWMFDEEESRLRNTRGTARKHCSGVVNHRFLTRKGWRYRQPLLLRFPVRVALASPCRGRHGRCSNIDLDLLRLCFLALRDA